MIADPPTVIEPLHPFEIGCVMRRRTALSREVLQRLPKLKLIASTGPRNASIDMQAGRGARYPGNLDRL
jgi:phosphoglycerate dehydrogenase-like enzyme